MLSNQFPFLSLPAEIRNKVYSLLLTIPDQPGRAKRLTGAQLTPSIIRVCRQVYSECAALLYTENLFQAHPSLLNALPYLYESSRPVLFQACSRLIQRFYLEVRLDCDPRWTSEDLRRAFTGVAELRILAWQSSYGTCSPEMLYAFASVRRVGLAKVEGSCVSPKLARWLESVMQSDEDCETASLDEQHWEIWADGNR